MRGSRNVTSLLTGLLLSVPLVTAAPGGATGALEALVDPLVPASAGGTERADRLLAKLGGHRRLLVIGAHPDDEDTTLIAYVARGLGGEAAYLSLSRGEGGQNLIGPELGVGLGLLRSRELLTARRVDGGRQFFTRAYDFGYTRSVAETLERWPRDVLLEDTVRVIRRFRPQVVVSIFPPDERAGHGQHEASGMVAGEAYELAGDPQAFPQLAAEGLSPWRPQAFYRSAWWRPEEATLTTPLGLLEPITGRSIFQIAMASRSQHRCQNMGSLEPLGSFTGRLAWERGAGGGARARSGDVFAGVDTRLAAIAEALPGSLRAAVAERLGRAEALAREARARLTAADPGTARPSATAIHRTLAEARRLLPAEPPPGPMATVAELIEEKQAVAAELVATTAGLGLDALAERELLVPGSDLRVEVTAWDASDAGVELMDVELITTEGLAVAPEAGDERGDLGSSFRGSGPDPEQGYSMRAFRVRVAPDAEPSRPYFLQGPLDGDLYDWSAAAPRVRGEPFEPPPLLARIRVRLAGEELELQREVVHRIRDQELGEVRRPLRIVPELEVALERELVVWPTDRAGARRMDVTLISNADRPLRGRLEMEVPAGWSAAAPGTFRLPEAGTRTRVQVILSPPDPLPPGAYDATLTAVVEAGAEGAVPGSHELALPLVEYPHVRGTPWPRPAALQVVAAHLALPALERVGYVRGAADRVPEALAGVGVPVELLQPGELAGGDLSRFDAIVIGARAYETDRDLARANARLLDYAADGGLVVVQYQQYQYTTGGYAPYALEIARPHGRITDEAAPVTLLEPEHPVFTAPNAIDGTDWDGWVQERGLYMPATWSEPFRPLLEIPDWSGQPQRGGLLLAPVGEGTYVYTGLAFFRQLPAGVPGAFRLFANLLALAEPREAP